MLTLQVDSLRAGPAGNLRVRWKASRAVLEDARKSGDAWMLLITSNETGADGGRYHLKRIVPLRDGEAFVSFRKEGANRIFARVVYGRRKDLERRFETATLGPSDEVGADGRDWAHSAAQCDARIVALDAALAELGRTVIVSEGDESGAAAGANAHNSRIASLQQDRDLQVRQRERFSALDDVRAISEPLDVPAECFAPKRGPAMTAWVNYFWGGKEPRNSCYGRGRALLAFTLQPFWILAAYVFRLLLALVCFSFFIVDLPWRKLVNPVRFGIFDVVEKIGPAFWLIEKKTPWPQKLRLAFFPATPFALLLTYLVAKNSIGAVNLALLPKLLLWSYLGTLGLCLVIGVFVVLGLLLTNPRYLSPMYLYRQFIERSVIEEEDVLALASDADATAVAGVKRQRPLRLWFEGVKAASCRPYQG